MKAGLMPETVSRLLGVGQIALVLSALLVPRVAAATAYLPPLVLLALTRPKLARPRILQLPRPLLVALIFGLYALISVGWSASRGEGAGKAALFLGLLAVLWVVREALGQQTDARLDAIARGTVLALAAGLLILAVEEASGHALRRGLYNILPFLRPPQKHIVVVNGEIESFGAYLTNRSMAALSLLLWPALGIVCAVLQASAARAAIAAALVLAAIAILNSQHDTSILALLGGCIAFAMGRIASRAAIGLLAAAWLASALLVVPAATMAFDKGLHMMERLPFTGRQRIVLWGYTAERVAERPILGVGIASTKALDALRGAAETPAGFPYPRRTGPHAHNIFLQTWYELGAVGAVVLAAFGLALLVSIRRASSAMQPFLLAGFASAAITGSFTWGLWQAWFMGAFGLSAMLGLLAAETARRQARAP